MKYEIRTVNRVTALTLRPMPHTPTVYFTISMTGPSRSVRICDVPWWNIPDAEWHHSRDGADLVFPVKSNVRVTDFYLTPL